MGLGIRSFGVSGLGFHGFMVWVFGCRSNKQQNIEGGKTLVQGSRFTVQGSGSKVQGSGFRIQGSGCKVHGAGFGVHGLPFRVDGSDSTKKIEVVRSWFSAEGLGFRSWDRKGRREAVHVDPLIWG